MYIRRNFIRGKVIMKLKEIGQTKDEITEMLSSNGLSHFTVTYHGCKGVFIQTDDGT
jgi:hypothetical protein